METLIQILAQIFNGSIQITPFISDDYDGPIWGFPQHMYIGNVTYTGVYKDKPFMIFVFNDCNSFDYICGFRYGEEQIECTIGPGFSDSIAWNIFKIPGYQSFRCITCGKELGQKIEETPHNYIGTCCGGTSYTPLNPCYRCKRHALNGKFCRLCNAKFEHQKMDIDIALTDSKISIGMFGAPRLKNKWAKSTKKQSFILK